METVAKLKNDQGDYIIQLPGRNYVMGVSYCYFGWVLDRLADPVIPPEPLSNFSWLAAGAGAFGFNVPPDGYSTAQLGHAVNSLLESAIPAITSSEPGIAMMRIADKDIRVPAGYGCGGGQSDTVYRVREGIERFLITDINNPAASAMAQSTVWLMLDLMQQRFSFSTMYPAVATFFSWTVMWNLSVMLPTAATRHGIREPRRRYCRVLPQSWDFS